MSFCIDQEVLRISHVVSTSDYHKINSEVNFLETSRDWIWEWSQKRCTGGEVQREYLSRVVFFISEGVLGAS